MKNGFYLLDTLAALAILAIVLLLSVPSLAQVFANRALRFEAARVAADLERLVLLSNQLRYDVELIFDERGYRAQRQPAGSLVLEHTVASGTSLRPRGKKQRFLFYGTGSATPGSFTLAGRAGSCIITLSLRGRVRTVC